MKWIYFEGGEPFLYYPLMLEGIKMARSYGFKVGLVTNAYFATNEADAELWLAPVKELGISYLSVSDDLFHYDEEQYNHAKMAVAAAEKLGMSVSSICIEKPVIEADIDKDQDKGTTVVGGGVMFRGRAVETLAEGLLRRKREAFTECPYEDLRSPDRVHVDPYEFVHICQGLCMGNIYKIPLSELVGNYLPEEHPICEPLLKGGPVRLAQEFGLDHEEKYVDACHFCYLMRRAMLDDFPDHLAPRQVYGLEDNQYKSR
jgi:MoaA/NifB/PqqE/SkfB family radical SAM enzyme